MQRDMFKLKQRWMESEKLHTEFLYYYTLPDILVAGKPQFQLDQEYTVSNTNSSHSAGPFNSEHIAKLPYFAQGRLEIKLKIYTGILSCLYDLIVLCSYSTAHDLLNKCITFS